MFEAVELQKGMGDKASSQEIKDLMLVKHVMPWANDYSTEPSLFAREGYRFTHTECRFESLGAFLLLKRQMFILEGSSVEVTPDQVTAEDFSHLAASSS